MRDPTLREVRKRMAGIEANILEERDRREPNEQALRRLWADYDGLHHSLPRSLHQRTRAAYERFSDRYGDDSSRLHTEEIVDDSVSVQERMDAVVSQIGRPGSDYGKLVTELFRLSELPGAPVDAGQLYLDTISNPPGQ